MIYLCAQQRLKLVWASVQSDWSLHCPPEEGLGPFAAHKVHRKDSDQTGQMLRLTLVFAGRTSHFVGFVVLWLRLLYDREKIWSKRKRAILHMY